MNSFSENEIKDILGEEKEEKKEKNSKAIAVVITAITLVAIVLAIVIPLSTINSDTAPEINDKHKISPIADFEYSISDGYATIISDTITHMSSYRKTSIL